MWSTTRRQPCKTYPIQRHGYNVFVLVHLRISNDNLSSQVIRDFSVTVASGRPDSKRKSRCGISFNLMASALVSLQSCRKRGSGRERQESPCERRCDYVCIVHALCTLVLEMHWRLGANHSPRRRGVSGAAARQNILPPGGRRSCSTYRSGCRFHFAVFPLLYRVANVKLAKIGRRILTVHDTILFGHQRNLNNGFNIRDQK